MYPSPGAGIRGVVTGTAGSPRTHPGLLIQPTEETRRVSVVTMKQLLESGVHFGHQTRRWNPKM